MNVQPQFSSVKTTAWPTLARERDVTSEKRGGGSHLIHSSNGPVRVSMQELSVSEASVCSVDMDEMSLIEDDWEAVALLFTVPSTTHTEQCIKIRAQNNVLS